MDLNKVNYFSAMIRLLHHVWSLLQQTISVLYETALTDLIFYAAIYCWGRAEHFIRHVYVSP